MNINQAKDYIKNSINIYLKKDEFGDYKIPVVRQRPIFMLGAPGIGKTAIMEQIAQELGIALVSYSMTHHTRQSALGLPFIKHKTYNNMEYDVSEYTMSEIIASIYDTMENSGVKEGILFLDEINCVSETLAPSMLQFLQYKVFGKHGVPEGWVIVTAGNPPEYNKSVREFDVVTLDRLKVITVEADFDTWKQYAMDKGIHNSILSFLELKKEYFYSIETTVKGRSYVTARGWEDLSDILYMYEEEGLTVEENLISQYLRNKSVVREFVSYYDLYNKYKKDYKIDEILQGNFSDNIITRAKSATFDERLSLMGMLLDAVLGAMEGTLGISDYLKSLMPTLKGFKSSEDILGMLQLQIDGRIKLITNMEKANSLSSESKKIHKRVIKFLQDIKKDITAGKQDNLEQENVYSREFIYIKNTFDSQVEAMKNEIGVVSGMLHNLFEFVVTAFGEERELLVLTTELTASSIGARFIAMFGSEDYSNYSQSLMISNRQNDLRETITKLELV